MASALPSQSSPTKLHVQVGFNAISFEHLDLRESTIKKGRELWESGHIFNVTEVRESASCPKIEGRCVRQTNVSSDPYVLCIHLDSNRSVTAATCKCQAGISGNCKHVAGKLFTL